MKDFFKEVAVFRTVYRVAVRSDYLYSAAVKLIGEVYGGLSSERSDNSDGIFKVDYVHDVLYAERFKVKLVGAGVVGGHGLGVVVYDYRLVAGLFDGRYRVNGGVVELNALTDSDRTGAENDNLLFVGHNGFVFVFVGRVEVGDVALKLGRAGVYHFVYGENISLLAYFVYLLVALAPELSDKRVGEAHFLRLEEDSRVSYVLGQLSFHEDDVLHLFKEEHIYLCRVVYHAEVCLTSHKLGYGVYSVVRAVLNVVEKLLVGKFVELLHVEVIYADFQ